MTRRYLVRLAGLTLVAVLVAGCGGASSKNYDAGATHECLAKSPDDVGLGWYPGKPKAPSPPTPFALLDGGRRTGVPFHGSLPYYGTNVGSGEQFIVALQSGFGSVHLVFFANAEQARYAYREMLSRVGPGALSYFKRSTLLNHNLFIDWETDPGPSKAVRSMVVDCLRTA